MANEKRVRNDNVQGTVAVALTSTSATLRATGLVNLEAISSTEHAAIVIDPGRTAGAPEIVHVTAHSASSTSATITRGREGTAARAHSSTEEWVHAPTATKDYVSMNPPTVQVTQDAVQSINNSSWEGVNFTVENWDTDGMFGSTNNKLHVNTPGKYLATFHGGFAASTLGTIRALGIGKNSTNSPNITSAGIAWDINTGITHQIPAVTIVSMTTSDYLTAMMFQNTGAGLNTTTSLGIAPTFSMLWVST